MNKSNEIWRVEINGHTLETDLAALKVMVCQGEVSETDKVAKGSLASIEAGRAPALRRVFSGQETLESIISEATAAANEPAFPARPLPSAPFTPDNFTTAYAPANPALAAVAEEDAAPPLTTTIPGEPLTVWTNSAPNEFAATVESPTPHNEFVWETPITNFQSPVAETNASWSPAKEEAPAAAPPLYEEESRVTEEHSLSNTGTPADCFQHPQRKPAFVCAACGVWQCKPCARQVGSVTLCAVCGELCDTYEEARRNMAQAVSQHVPFGLKDFGRALIHPCKGGIGTFLTATLYAAMYCFGVTTWIFSVGLLYGYMSSVIRQVSIGRWERGSDIGQLEFNFYDSVLAPCFRGVAVMVMTWAPLLIAMLALFNGTVGSYNRHAEQEKQRQLELQKEGQFRQQWQEDRVKAIEGIKVAMNKDMEKATGQSDQETLKDTIGALWKGAPDYYVLVLALALLWAIFYYPMAMMVAGFTESAVATFNPGIGFDTIRHLGFDYFKTVGMCLLVTILGAFLSTQTFKLLKPFDMPLVGNVPARFMDAIITFYASMVVACILGLVIFRNARKLNLATD